MTTATSEPALGRQPITRADFIVLGGLVAVAAAAIALGFAGASRVQPVAGLAVILGLAYCLSSARRAIDYRTVGWGLGLQFVFVISSAHMPPDGVVGRLGLGPRPQVRVGPRPQVRGRLCGITLALPQAPWCDIDW